MSMSHHEKKEAWSLAVDKLPIHKHEHFNSNSLFHSITNNKDTIPNIIKKGGHDEKAKKKDPFVVKNTKLQNILNKIYEIWSDEESNLRLSWTTAAIIVFSFIAAGIFFAVEHDDTKCKWTYWRCLWLINTIYTTIGYGSLHPCTLGGRLTAVILAFIGIPLNVLALADVGKLLARFLATVWDTLFKDCWKMCKSVLCHKNKTKVIIEDQTDPDKKKKDHMSSSEIPLWFALLVTFTWFIATACFFAVTEPDKMSFGDALYFVMISITTVGFGDVVPEKYELVVFQFFFVIIGISLFSMVISIVQEKMYSMSDNVESLIAGEYAKAQIDGSTLSSDEDAAREHIRHIIRRQKGGLGLRFVMSKHMEDRLVQDYVQKSQKILVGTQTDNEMADKEIMAVCHQRHVMCQANFVSVSNDHPQPEVKHQEIQVVPKKKKPTFEGLNWLDLNTTEKEMLADTLQGRKSNGGDKTGILGILPTKKDSSTSKPIVQGSSVQHSRKSSQTTSLKSDSNSGSKGQDKPESVTEEKYGKIMTWLQS